MPKDTQQQFELFMSQLKETNATLEFYCDFEKISQNVANISISLNMLNYLLGKKDLRGAVEALWKRDPKAFDAMDILLATRKNDHKLFLDETGTCRPIHSLFNSVDGVMEFLYGTGLDKVFLKPEINNLVDYVFGVETGLDTNARKNRSGKAMESYIAKRLSESTIGYERQVSSKKYPTVSKVLGTDQKVFDFAVETPKKVFLIEANFYSNGGSKLNEVARSYAELGSKVNSVQGFEFVWITDGFGWFNAQNKLREAFNTIPSIYNLSTIHAFINSLQQ